MLSYMCIYNYLEIYVFESFKSLIPRMLRIAGVNFSTDLAIILVMLPAMLEGTHTGFMFLE